MKRLITDTLFAVLVMGMGAGRVSGATLLHYDFSGTGTTVSDLSGNGYDGTLEGFTTAGTGLNGAGQVVFGDRTDTITTGLPQTRLAGDFTVDVIFTYTGPETGWYMLVGCSVTPFSGAQLFQIGKRGGPSYSRELYIQIAGVLGPQTFVPLEDVDVFDGQQHRLVVTYSQTEALLRVFVDGSDTPAWSVEAGTGHVGTQNILIGNAGHANESFIGSIDAVAISNESLDPSQFVLSQKPGQARNPYPADGKDDVPRDTLLSWTAGEFAATHDVYLGTVFADVNDASRANPDILASQGQIATTYQPAAPLEYGQTYYWRVDEVNAPPSSTIFKGNVWSFETEPVGYPIANANITATASSTFASSGGPERTIDGSGLNDSDQHSTNAVDMWLSGMLAPQPTWIEYQFDKVYKLHEMWVWNQNQIIEPAIGYGFKDVTIEYSADGVTYTTLGITHEFVRAPGVAGYAANTTVDFGGIVAKYVKLTPNSNWGGILEQYGISEVRFFFIPVWAREPDPASGAQDVEVDSILAWRSGREADRHDVYLNTDEQTVIDGTADVVTVTEPDYTPSFDLGSTYYWRIDEVNDAETPAIWQGDVLNFTTQEYLVVDDFESYNDVPAGEEGSNLVYLTWLDGFEIPTNGSTMGYTVAFQPTMESDIVHSGKQSAPMAYDNTAAAISEVMRAFTPAQDWTAHGIKSLSLWFSGDPANTGTLYLKINNTKVPYDGDAADITRPQWQPWNIDLSAVDTDVTDVTMLTLGVEGAGATGVLYIDDIRLYPNAPEVITPVEPDPAGLVLHLPLDGDYRDATGNGHDGTPLGAPEFVDDADRGQVLEVDGWSSYVMVDDAPDLNYGADESLTMTAWVLWDEARAPGGWRTAVLKGRTAPGGDTSYSGLMYGFLVHPNGNWVVHAGPFAGATVPAVSGEWTHLAFVQDGPNNEAYAFIDLGEVASGPAASCDTTGRPLFIGASGTDTGPAFEPFGGRISDVRIYDRALSVEEIAWLAGKRVPRHKPF